MNSPFVYFGVKQVNQENQAEWARITGADPHPSHFEENSKALRNDWL